MAARAAAAWIVETAMADDERGTPPLALPDCNDAKINQILIALRKLEAGFKRKDKSWNVPTYCL